MRRIFVVRERIAGVHVDPFRVRSRRGIDIAAKMGVAGIPEIG